MSFLGKLFNTSSDEWVYIGSDEYIADYYNLKTIEICKDPQPRITVECKRVYTNKGRKKLFNYWETKYLSNDEINDIHHSYTGYICNYNDRKMAWEMTLLVTTYASRSDKIIVGYMFQTDDIKPGTVDDKILDKYVYYPSECNEIIKPGTINEAILNKIIKDYNIQ